MASREMENAGANAKGKTVTDGMKTNVFMCTECGEITDGPKSGYHKCSNYLRQNLQLLLESHCDILMDNNKWISCPVCSRKFICVVSMQFHQIEDHKHLL